MHRILLTVGGFPIYSFGALVALGVLVGGAIFAHLAPRHGFSRDRALETMVWVVILGVMLARVAYVLQNLPAYLAHPLEIMDFRGGGMSWHGAVVGILLGVWWNTRAAGVSTIDVLDAAAPSIMLGLAVGRVGCLLNGCCYGRPAHAAWSLVFPDVDALPRHPTQIYEMLLALLMFAVLMGWRERRAFRGEVMLGFLVLYSLVRFVVEFFREGAILAAGLTLAQFVSLALIAGAGLAIAARRLHSPAEPALAGSASRPDAV